MRHLELSHWAAVLTLAIALAPITATAQEADTLRISGTFHSAGRVSINGFEYPGTIGTDLAEVYANSNENAWMLTLHGVAYSHDYYLYEWGYGYNEEYITRVCATSFDFEFFGPDADVLNEVVSQQLLSGFFELRNGYQIGSLFSDDDGPYRSLELGLSPLGEGVSFYVTGPAWAAQFSTDEQGYPVVEPQLVWAHYSTITDFRPGNSGGLVSFGDLVDIGSSGPPVLPPPPPPPPPPPTLSIADGSAREGNKGTSRLDLTVTLSRTISDVVTMNYATANGTAQTKSDYTATSGTLTVQAGQTQGTVSLAIKADRKREKNETFTVQLSNAVGATIEDGSATVTILNDD